MFPGDKLDPGQLLAQLIGRPAWQADGLCLEHSDVSWFPERGSSTVAAKAICGCCLVRTECVRFALDDPTL